MTESSEIPTTEVPKKHKLPGGEYEPLPIEIDGVFYDPFNPPKLHRGPDGEDKWIGGKKLDKDEIYAARFWKDQPEGMREVMIENIHKATEVGYLGCFVDPSGPTEKDKTKLSAYRKLACELGLEVGDFTFDKNAFVSRAPIKKAQFTPKTLT